MTSERLQNSLEAKKICLQLSCDIKWDESCYISAAKAFDVFRLHERQMRGKNNFGVSQISIKM